MFTLDVTVSGNGAVQSSPAGINCPGTCGHSFPSDTVVTLTPVPDPENMFGGWSNCDAPSCPSCNVTMNGNKSIMATFWNQCEILLRQMGYEP
jgi:trimeric autotransporter adhesin